MSNLVPRRMMSILALTLTLALCIQVPFVALADDTGSSDAGSTEAVAQSDDSSSGAVQATEVPAPVAEQAPVAAQSTEKDGWNTDAGGTYYVEGGSRVSSSWLVLNVAPSGEKAGWQRYWVGADGYLVRGRLVTETESGRWAYAEADGTIARGRYADPSTGYVYLADNDGRLESQGWHVTSAYGSGTQRYWVDATAHACVPGYSADGWDHYTTPAGYVLRGRQTDASTGDVYLADNDGRLESPGWHVTSAYGSGTQRYWVDASAHACVPGYSADGWAHYTTAAGYVLRGASTDSATGYVYLADNDGLLAGPGWIIGDFGNGLQRYWVDAEKHACVPGYSKDGWAHWTTTYGYVLRGAQHYDEDGVLLADNEGKLAECYSSGGWLVTSAFTGSLERYRIDDCCGGILGAHVGPFSIGDDKYCGNSATGYVYRNCYTSGLYDLWGYFDNDGILRKLDGAPLTETQKKILAAAETTPSPGLGWCAAWVEYVYENAVGGSFGGDARDLYKYYCTLSDISQIRPGMIVAVSTHSHSSAGRRYGHVGIYMGNGVVYDNEGYIRHISLLEWVSYYGDIVTPKWGVLGNISLD